MNKSTLLHACSLCLGNYGILIKGDSGAGKSTICLALIERAHNIKRKAALVSDDYVLLTKDDQKIIAHTPDAIKGLIEIRGAGVFKIDYQDNTPINLVVELNKQGERYPTNDGYDILGVAVPYLHLPNLKNANPISICQAIEATLFKKAYKL